MLSLSLRPFAEADAAAIVGWVRSPRELSAWCARTDFPLPPSVVCGWHREPDVRAFVLEVDGAPGAYGEVWEDAAEAEAELARLLVAPALRGRGVGRRLVALLVACAREWGHVSVTLRVLADNAPALACYRAAGFVRESPSDELSFNRDQPRPYQWFRHVPKGAEKKEV